MRLTFLGTGTSYGVPILGCECRVCTSSDPRDRRTRHGALLELPGGKLLIDTPPELRLQLLAAGVRRVGAVWYTHLHADHVHGIDDVRVFSTRGRGPVPAHLPEETIPEMRARFPYIFQSKAHLAKGVTTPRIRLHGFREGEPVSLLGTTIVPFRVPHGRGRAYGLRVGALGYVTDAKRLPSTARRILADVEVLVVNALWWGKSHPHHFNIEEALEAASDIGAKRTFLTHLTHKVKHADLVGRLPRGVEPAWDGLTVEIP